MIISRTQTLCWAVQMIRKFSVFCGLVVLLPCLAWGQVSGSISGTVTDPTGSVIPGATVTATAVETKAAVAAKTSGEGRYQFLELRPGVYDVQADAPGFKKLTRSGVTLEVAGRITLDLAMDVGTSTEVVSVTAEAPQLRTEDEQIGEVIDQTMIRNLPQLDRNPLELVQLSGNVSGSGISGPTCYAGGCGSADLTISGGRTMSLDYTVDGINISTGRWHGIEWTAVPTMESVAEFKVITGGMSAEYGRSSGGLVEVVTQGGTNQLHGQGFEYFRNQLLNANSWFQNATGGQRQVYKQNIFGGAIGGPVVIPKLYNGRNKTFWFFDYQGHEVAPGCDQHAGGRANPGGEER